MTRWILGCLTAFILSAHIPGYTWGEEVEGYFDEAQIILQIPYGIKNSGAGSGASLAPQGSRIDSMIIVESYSASRLFTDLRLEIPKPFEPEKGLEGIKIEDAGDRYVLSAEFELVTEFDDWYRTFTVLVPASAPPGNYSITVEAVLKGVIRGEEREFTISKSALVRVATLEEIQRLITVREIIIPADLDGRSDGKFAQNSIFLKSDLGLWGKILGGKETGDIPPVSFIGITMSNQANEDVIALVSWEVLDPRTGKEVEGFRISRDFLDMHGAMDNRINTRVFIPAKEEVEFVLPIFADEDKVLPGIYLGRIKSGLFGSDITFRTDDLELSVQRMDWATVGATLYALFITLGIAFFLIVRHRLLFQRFKTRWLILISLFGTAKFLMSVVPRFFLSELFNGLMGPFGVFATGFFTEVTYLFVMALVVLIPLPGVVTLSMLMSVLLFCLLGSFNPVIILFMMVSMSTMEIALYLTGFTRNRDPNFTRTGRALILAALGMGTAGAFATYVDYNLYMLLYRLYYAKWYILANISIVGFLYTALLAPAGVMLGNKLRRVAIE